MATIKHARTLALQATSPRINPIALPTNVTVATGNLSDGAVTNPKIGTGAVTDTKIGTGAVTTTKIDDAAITTAKITDGSITNAKIGALAVDTANIASAAITSAKIGALAVGTAQITDAAITNAKIGALAVDSAKIADASITNAKIGALAVDAAKIAAATITTAKIANAAITTALIADANITTAKIADANITTAKIANAAITTALIADANITTAKIADANITTAKIADAQITTAKIADAQITAAKIVDATITTAKIADAQITAAKIVDATITDAKIANLSASKINAGTISANYINGGTMSASTISLTGASGSHFLAGPGLGYVSIGNVVANGYIEASASSASKPAVRGDQNYNALGVHGSVSGGASHGSAHGVRGENGYNGATGIVGCANGYDFYADGSGTNYGPFTGAHDALAIKGATLELGDIVVDQGVAVRKNLSNTLCSVAASSAPAQPGAVGVVVSLPRPLADDESLPAAMRERVTTTDPTGRPVVTQLLCPEWYTLRLTHEAITINALGEGQVNVCGENGALAIGDLITTSSMPGKGMRQSDDVVRSHTVAKCREAVVFDFPEQVRTVACIYLCG